MAYLNVDVDVSIDEIYWELSDREKQELIDKLKQDGFLTKRDTEYEEGKSVLQQLFEVDVEKIRNAYFTMSKEDIDIINQIAKKY